MLRPQPKNVATLLQPFAQKTSVKQCLLQRCNLQGGSPFKVVLVVVPSSVVLNLLRLPPKCYDSCYEFDLKNPSDLPMLLRCYDLQGGSHPSGSSASPFFQVQISAVLDFSTLDLDFSKSHSELSGLNRS
jgi:hypothetical protein